MVIQLIFNNVAEQAINKEGTFINFLANIKAIAQRKDRSFMVMLSWDIDNQLRCRLYRHGKHSDSQCYSLGIITHETNVNATYEHMVVALTNKLG